jgi:hypothetical protein
MARLPEEQTGAGGGRLIVLLDLNFTFVENRKESLEAGAGDFDRRLANERYREWLRDLVKGQYVIMITARPDSQKARTLDNIKRIANWQPDEAYFNEKNLLPPECKKDILERCVFPKHGIPGKGVRYVAVESNPRTMAMYASLGVPGLRVWEPAQYRQRGTIGEDPQAGSREGEKPRGKPQ